VPLAQRAVLLPQVIHGGNQLLDAPREARQLEIELRFDGVAHADTTIVPRSRRGQSQLAVLKGRNAELSEGVA
jgi:hypothetical protein